MKKIYAEQREEIQDLLLEALFGPNRAWLKKLRQALALKNMKYHGVEAPRRFMYRRNEFAPKGGSHADYIKLHPNLRDEAAGIIKIIEEAELEKAQIKGYLGTMLLRCRTHADLKAILPSQLYDQLPDTYLVITEDCVQTLASHDIQKVRVNYEGIQTLVQARMVKNLIER